MSFPSKIGHSVDHVAVPSARVAGASYADTAAPSDSRFTDSDGVADAVRGVTPSAEIEASAGSAAGATCVGDFVVIAHFLTPAQVDAKLLEALRPGGPLAPGARASELCSGSYSYEQAMRQVALMRKVADDRDAVVSIGEVSVATEAIVAAVGHEDRSVAQHGALVFCNLSKTMPAAVLNQLKFSLPLADMLRTHCTDVRVARLVCEGMCNAVFHDRVASTPVSSGGAADTLLCCMLAHGSDAAVVRSAMPVLNLMIGQQLSAGDKASVLLHAAPTILAAIRAHVDDRDVACQGWQALEKVVKTKALTLSAFEGATDLVATLRETTLQHRLDHTMTAHCCSTLGGLAENEVTARALISRGALPLLVGLLRWLVGCVHGAKTLHALLSVTGALAQLIGVADRADAAGLSAPELVSYLDRALLHCAQAREYFLGAEAISVRVTENVFSVLTCLSARYPESHPAIYDSSHIFPMNRMQGTRSLGFPLTNACKTLRNLAQSADATRWSAFSRWKAAVELGEAMQARSQAVDASEAQQCAIEALLAMSSLCAEALNAVRSLLVCMAGFDNTIKSGDVKVAVPAAVLILRLARGRDSFSTSSIPHPAAVARLMEVCTSFTAATKLDSDSKPPSASEVATAAAAFSAVAEFTAASPHAALRAQLRGMGDTAITALCGVAYDHKSIALTALEALSALAATPYNRPGLLRRGALTAVASVLGWHMDDAHVCAAAFEAAALLALDLRESLPSSAIGNGASDSESLDHHDATGSIIDLCLTAVAKHDAAASEFDRTRRPPGQPPKPVSAAVEEARWRLAASAFRALAHFAVTVPHLMTMRHRQQRAGDLVRRLLSFCADASSKATVRSGCLLLCCLDELSTLDAHSAAASSFVGTPPPASAAALPSRCSSGGNGAKSVGAPPSGSPPTGSPVAKQRAPSSWASFPRMDYTAPSKAAALWAAARGDAATLGRLRHAVAPAAVDWPSVLHLAAVGGHTAAVDAVFSFKFIAPLVTTMGGSDLPRPTAAVADALATAVAHGHELLQQHLLLKFGADPAGAGGAAFWLAAEQHSIETLDRLLYCPAMVESPFGEVQLIRMDRFFNELEMLERVLRVPAVGAVTPALAAGLVQRLVLDMGSDPVEAGAAALSAAAEQDRGLVLDALMTDPRVDVLSYATALSRNPAASHAQLRAVRRQPSVLRALVLPSACMGHVNAEDLALMRTAAWRRRQAAVLAFGAAR